MHTRETIPLPLALVLAISLAIALAASGCRGEAREPPSSPPPAAVQVDAITVETRPMPRSLALTGSLAANQQADVAANASGRVMRTFVERGAWVRAGDPLVQLDVRAAAISELEAHGNVESAQAQSELAKAQCERNDALYRKGAISRDEWDRYRSQCRSSAGSVTAARARAEQARKTHADGTVRAPFAGMIGERFVSVGEYVQPSSKVASLVELTPLRLQLTVPEADLGRVKRGQTVAFEVRSYPGETFSGQIAYVGPALRVSTRDLVVEAVVPNADRRLRPGMFAAAQLRLEDQAVPAVPRSSMRGEGSAARVYAIIDGHVQERVIQPGAERDGWVAVVEGVRAGERVVRLLSDQVRDGVSVR